MKRSKNLSPAVGFDPAAWVAEYESIGGKVMLMLEPDGAHGLGLTFPRDPEGRGMEMMAELNTEPGRREREAALDEYLSRTRGAMVWAGETLPDD